MDWCFVWCFHGSWLIICGVGASLYFSILPLLRDYITKGGTDKDFQFLGALNNASIYLLSVGLAFIFLSVLGARRNIFGSIRRHNPVLPRQIRISWERSTQIATILGTTIAIVMLGFIINSLDSTDKQLANTISQVNYLSNLTEESNKQLEALNKTITEIHHQTILNAYVTGGLFHLELIDCGTNNESTFGGEGKTLRFSPVMYNEKNIPTPIQFLAYLNFEYHGISNSTDKYLGGNSTSMRLIDPPKQEQWHLDLTDILNTAKDQDYHKVQIVLATYTFAPFSDAKNELITKYYPWNYSRPVLTEFDYNNGEWDMVNSPNFICTQNLNK